MKMKIEEEWHVKRGISSNNSFEQRLCVYSGAPQHRTMWYILFQIMQIKSFFVGCELFYY